MAQHKRGDADCAACRKGYPIPCECGGLVHASKGCVITTDCDNCADPRPRNHVKDCAVNYGRHESRGGGFYPCDCGADSVPPDPAQ